MSEIKEPSSPRRYPRSFFWPLVLISVGVLLLLSNLGYLPWESWNLVWRFWPLLLIALGIDVVIGRRSTIGAIVSGLLILLLIGGAIILIVFARNIPALYDLTQLPGVRTEHIEYPLGDVKNATVNVDWADMPGYLSALDDSSNLIEGDITYRGDLTFNVEVQGNQANVVLDSYFAGPWLGYFDFGGRDGARWDVKLSPKVSLDLDLDAGSGSCHFDLADLQVNGLVLDVGSGSVDLVLPASSTFDMRVDGGSGSLDIILPAGVGARVALDTGSGSFHPDERFKLVGSEQDDDEVWETGDFDSAAHTIVLKIDQGSGSISIREQ